MIKYRGFTLIELLVVISIIAVLMAVMVPSLQKARESARTVVCSNNQRQASIASLMYCEDNKGMFPRPFYQQGVTYLFITQMLRPYLGSANSTMVDANGETRYFYDLWQCPSTKVKNEQWWEVSFNINWMIGGEWTVKTGGTLPKKDEIFSPSNVILFADYAPQSSTAVYAFNFYKDQVDMKAGERVKQSFRHNGKIVVSYADGACGGRLSLEEANAPQKETYNSLKVEKPWNPWRRGQKNGRPIY